MDIEEGEGLYSAAPDGSASEQGTPQITATVEPSSATTDTVEKEEDRTPRPRRRKAALRMRTADKNNEKHWKME